MTKVWCIFEIDRSQNNYYTLISIRSTEIAAQREVEERDLSEGNYSIDEWEVD